MHTPVRTVTTDENPYFGGADPVCASARPLQPMPWQYQPIPVEDLQYKINTDRRALLLRMLEGSL